ncbi:metalloprotease [Haloferula sp. A504]|uniref:metalloprotease n=1 Tax=Haloferula sp. A504 TaxID=3373601 RepID=UPI0031C49E92|nr:hypothetical protein [Verrucomicrobiaceae bacterium E54]
MLRFSLFGIPVEVQPFFWIVIAMFGGALSISSSSDLMGTAVFMVAATASILVHEFGHALTGRRLGGGSVRIVLWAFGGLAYNEGGRFTRSQRFWMIFMGPGAGFLFLALVLVLLAVFLGPKEAVGCFSWAAFRVVPEPFITDALKEFVDPGNPNPRWWIARSLIWINFWWSLINLLPVLPLDGGQIANLWVHPQRRMFLVSAITGASMALFGFAVMGSLYVAILFGFLAYRSYQDFQSGGFR